MKTLRYGSETKDGYSDARKFLAENPLPKYMTTGRVGQSYSIYFKSTESDVGGIGPIERYKKVKAAEALVDYAFWNLPE